MPYARRVALGGIGLLAVASLVLLRVASASSALLEVHMLDVGQGDAALIVFPDGNQVLVDGGPDASVLTQLGEVMSPIDSTIDVVIATHPDQDHIGGLVDVLERFEVDTIVVSGIESDTQLYRTWVAAIADEVRDGAQLVLADGVKRLQFGDGAAIDLLWPQGSLLGEANKDVNEHSIVAQLRYGAFDMLFAGDVGRWAEQRIVASGVLADVEVLKVPHHGSKTSTTQALLETTTPELATISSGKDNRYGHPSHIVLERLHGAMVETIRTDERGRFTIQSDGAAYWLE